MTWLETQQREVLETALWHSECCMLCSTVDGKILWANSAFVAWSGYTLGELQNMSWMDLSVRDGSLVADQFEANKLDGYMQSYSVRKQYIPKQSKPVWGTLRVLRYPAYGEMLCCICTWHPLQDDSKEAFSLAVEAIGKVQSEIEKLSAMVNQIEARSLLESTVVMAIKLGIKYPKSSWTIMVTFVIAIGGNAGFDLLQKVLTVISAAKAIPQ
jgi:PAS domain S-box-containing protein